MKRLVERLLVASVVATVVCACGELVLPTVICAACAYGCNRKLESYG